MDVVVDDPLQVQPGPSQWGVPFANFKPYNVPTGEEGLRQLALQVQPLRLSPISE